VLVGRQAARGEADTELPAPAEADLRTAVRAPDEALPQALGRPQPVRVPLEHVGEPWAADLLGSLADPEDGERRRRLPVLEPELERLQPRRDVGLVVARAARVHATVPDRRGEGVGRPRLRGTRWLDVVVRVDEDAVGPGSAQLAENHRRAPLLLVELDLVEAAAHPRDHPAGHLLERGGVARRDRRDPARLAPLLDQRVARARDRTLDGSERWLRAQARTGTT
jgi:hypothetical protein